MISQMLKKVRQEKGVTAKAVADELGILPDTYRSYETGRREPNLETLIAIANYYNVSVDYLLGRCGAPEPIKQLTDNAMEQDMIDTYIKLPKDVRIQILQWMVDTVRKNDERRRKASIAQSQAVARAQKGPLEPHTQEQDDQLLHTPIIDDL